MEQTRGINLTGNIRVFRNAGEDGKVRYRTTLSHKNADDTFTNAGIGIRFRNGVEFADESTLVAVKSAKLDFFKSNEGYPVFYLFAFDAETSDDEEARKGLNLTGGQVMIFRNEGEDGKVRYRMTVSHKNADDTYTNAGIDVRFNKDIDLPDRTIVDIKSAKLDFYKNKANQPVYFVRAFDFEIVG